MSLAQIRISLHLCPKWYIDRLKRFDTIDRYTGARQGGVLDIDIIEYVAFVVMNTMKSRHSHAWVRRIKRIKTLSKRQGITEWN